MYKRLIILITFLAYSLSLVHSLVPHHHDEETQIGHHHHHHGSEKDHHHHGSEKDHHHPEQDHENKSLSQVFADALHHPASEVVIHTPQSENVEKKNAAVDDVIFIISQLIFPELKPPDIPIHHREKHYSSNGDSFFLLRAPPVA